LLHLVGINLFEHKVQFMTTVRLLHSEPEFHPQGVS